MDSLLTPGGLPSPKILLGWCAALLLVAGGIYYVGDFGLEFERTRLLPDATFTVEEGRRASFSPAQGAHVIEHVVGREPSRISTAHGYNDRVYIEFRDTGQTDGFCEVVQAERLGYRRGGVYRVQSLDDVSVTIRRQGQGYEVSGSVRATLVVEGGFDDAEHCDIHLPHRTLYLPTP